MAAERAATAQQLVHGWDLATRAALGRALAGVGQVGVGWWEGGRVSVAAGSNAFLVV